MSCCVCVSSKGDRVAMRSAGYLQNFPALTGGIFRCLYVYMYLLLPKDIGLQQYQDQVACNYFQTANSYPTFTSAASSVILRPSGKLRHTFRGKKKEDEH